MRDVDNPQLVKVEGVSGLGLRLVDAQEKMFVWEAKETAFPEARTKHPELCRYTGTDISQS